jgi:hypothetical protein
MKNMFFPIRGKFKSFDCALDDQVRPGRLFAIGENDFAFVDMLLKADGPNFFRLFWAEVR